MAGIVYLDYYLPKTYQQAKDILEKSNLIEKSEINNFITSSNLDKISVEEFKTPLHGIITLFDEFAKKNIIDFYDVSHIIYTGIKNSMYENISLPYLIQNKYNCINASTLIIEQQCASVLQALQLAESLVNNGKGNNVIIFTTNYYGDNNRFIGTTIVGDGAGILVVGKEKKNFDIIDSKTISNGSYSNALYSEKNDKGNRLSIIQNGSKHINQILKKNSIPIDSLDAIIPLNINAYWYNVYAKILKISIDNFFLENISYGGHISDVDIIRNLKDYQNNYTLNKDRKILLYTLGTVGMDVSYSIYLLNKV